MFGQGSFVNLNGAGGEVRLAQAPVFSGPSAPMPAAPAPAPQPALVPAGPPLPVLAPAPEASSLSRGAQVGIGVAILGLTILGAIFLTD